VNTPTHIAAAGLVSATAFFADAKFGTGLPIKVRLWICAAGCVVLGASSHLLLDALPHYNWIVYLHWLSDLPYHWLVRDALFGLVIVIPILYWGRDRWFLIWLTLFAAMYPDFEKVAYIDFGLPRQLVIFRGHSLQLSGNDWGLPHPWLIALEVSLIFVCLTVSYCLSKMQARLSMAVVGGNS
jgi:hypothetical protein